MTRKKKARTTGSEGPAQYKDRNVSKEDAVALTRKRENRAKGLKAGNRQSDGKTQQEKTGVAKADPRLGSKKLIPLVVEKKAHPKSAKAKKERRLSAEQELDILENDELLNVLLERIENGEKLGAGLQSTVDEKLDRIEVLMKQLGMFDEQTQEETETQEPLKKQTSKKQASKKRTDDDMLAEFENFKFEDQE